MSFLKAALRPLAVSARGYATTVTGFGKEVEGFVGAVGNTPLVSNWLLPATASMNAHG
jgi:cysteine synthase A